MNFKGLWRSSFAVLAIFASAIAKADPPSIQSQFADPPNESRPMVRWWWFGPAVTNAGLEREMRAMEGGFGGFEVQPTYPLAINGNPPGVKNVQFLSPGFFSSLAFVAAKSHELGLRMDLTLGSGWPYGGPMFSIDEAAGRLRIEHLKIGPDGRAAPMPALRPGESLIASFIGDSELPATRPTTATSEPAKDSPIDFFIAGHTGMKVKRPAFGADGYVIDHLSKPVVQKFIKEIGEREIAACADHPPYAIFCDSLEVAGEDWTDHFLDEFQKRRGYDLRPLLPALISDANPKYRDIRHDWGQTLTEVFNDSFMKPLHALAAEHKSRFRIQAYGFPSANLTSYANADLPEGEGYQWHGYRASRYASSACHLLGIPVASSEAFTWIHSPPFRATPLDIKGEANLHFLQGINQLVCHGWPYTPDGVADPGGSFYAAGVFDDKNPWYFVMPDVTNYIARISWMLRQGTPANDLALYLADDDAWANFTPGHISLTDGVGARLGPDIVGRILDAGYNLDFFNDGLLNLRGKVDGDSLSFGDVRFKAVILAGVERIPLSAMRKLESFAKSGGILVATRRLPAIVPGYKATDADQEELSGIVDGLFKGPNPPAIFVADEKNLADALKNRLEPDVKFDPPQPAVGFVHRHTEFGECYFLANTGNVPADARVMLRTGPSKIEAFDPMTGHVSPVTSSPSGEGHPKIAIHLEPYESRIFVLSAQTPTTAPTTHTTQPTTLRTAMDSIDISKGWQVRFAKDTPPVPFATLHSWTDDKATIGFSGIASYSNTIDVAPDMIANNCTQYLTFGPGSPAKPHLSQGFAADFDPPIRDAAVVYVNGKRAGSLWSPPYSMNVTGLLNVGQNSFRIDVANTAINHLAAAGFPNYDYAALVKTFGERFKPQDVALIKPIPSGILGEVQIISVPAAVATQK